MNNLLSAGLVKRSLAAHSSLGLSVGALMYLVCLTGTIAVFADYFERWEQPRIAEFTRYDAKTVENAIDGWLQAREPPESLYVVLPTDTLPRMHVSSGEEEFWLEADGALAEPVAEGWTHMLRDLHIHLHLPETLGLFLVSAMGAMLVAMILSGVLAHPRIFRDAFRLRLGGSRRLEQADLHNRLSVWGLPFHLMIAVTGGFFGLVALLIAIASPAFYGGDADALIADVYGGDPIIDAPVEPLAVGRALSSLERIAPQAEPIYLVAHELGTRSQYMEIAATLPGRLTYSEIYRFSAAGEFIGHQGLADGPLSRQVLYSVYRIHFGWFGGLPVRFAWFALGLALTVVSATGVNVWLARRQIRTRVNDLWCATVWGIPAALAVSAALSLLTALPALPAFVACWAAAILAVLMFGDVTRSRRTLQGVTAMSLLAAVAGHYAQHRHAFDNPVYPAISVSLLVVAILFAWPAWRRARSLEASHAR